MLRVDDTPPASPRVLSRRQRFREEREKQAIEPVFPAVRARAVHRLRAQRREPPLLCSALASLAPMIVGTPPTLKDGGKRDDMDHAERPGLTTRECERPKRRGRASPRNCASATSVSNGPVRDAGRRWGT